ncbi:pseudouridine synthase [Syncephalis fuscata]|nr:pseudouridine synthase [Syncephalis fuscata]
MTLVEGAAAVAAAAKKEDIKDKPTWKELEKLRGQLNGVFAVNKPSGLSSYDVVDKIKHQVFGMQPRNNNKHPRKKFNQKIKYKVGHGGTLDPLATGVLVIGVNGGTKELDKYLNGAKVYVGEGLLGSMTDTYDSEGHLEKTAPYTHVTRESIERVLDQFRGQYSKYRLYIRYSALKVNGRPMYDYARKGEEIPRELVAREVTIYSLELEEFTVDHSYRQPVPKPTTSTQQDGTNTKANKSTLSMAIDTADEADSTTASDIPPPAAVFRLRVECSGGTYIRSLIYDIGRAVGSTAHMVSLSRVQQGCFKLGENVGDLDTCNIESVAQSIEASKQLINK